MRHRFVSLSAPLCMLLVVLASVQAQQTQLTRSILQDEAQVLPTDNTAFYTAGREVSIQLDMLAAVAGGMDQTIVSVVTPSGQNRNFRPGATGLVTIDNVRSGPYTIVASSPRSHGTSLVYFQRLDERDPVVDPDSPAIAQREPLPTRVTLVDIRSPNTLRPFIDEIRDVSGPRSDVRGAVEAEGEFGYRVKLGPGGRLGGSIVSVERPAVMNLARTRVSILQDGSVVDSTSTDVNGQWEINGVDPGIYGLIAAGPAGYTAFSFEAIDPQELALQQAIGPNYVTVLQAFPTSVPVTMVPPAYIPSVLAALAEHYPQLFEQLFGGSAPDSLLDGPASTPGLGRGGAGGGVTGDLSAARALGGLTAAGLGAVIASIDNDDGTIVVPPPVSPVNPPVSVSQEQPVDPVVMEQPVEPEPVEPEPVEPEPVDPDINVDSDFPVLR